MTDLKLQAPRWGEVTVGGAVVCCEQFDREPCPHDPARRCAHCPGNAPTWVTPAAHAAASLVPSPSKVLQLCAAEPVAPDLVHALRRLLVQAKMAQARMLREAGVGLIDLSAIAQAEAALAAHTPNGDAHG